MYIIDFWSFNFLYAVTENIGAYPVCLLVSFLQSNDFVNPISVSERYKFTCCSHETFVY